MSLAFFILRYAGKIDFEGKISPNLVDELKMNVPIYDLEDI